MTQNAIQLTSVRKTFGHHTAVDNLDLSVPEGSIYGFIGPNGSGKTTTLRMILRIYQPDSGTVEVLGNTEGKTADDRLGYLPEERGLYKRMRVGDLLTYYARLKGLWNCKEEIDSWLTRLGAEGWQSKRIDSLSKGMAQKVQFISAIVAKPKLLILDEPFSGLDPVNVRTLQEAISYVRKQGTTIVFSTHDMDMAEKMCDMIFMIYRGKKVLDGSLESIRKQYQQDLFRVAFSSSSRPENLPGLVHVRTEGNFEFYRAQDVNRLNSAQAAEVFSSNGSLAHCEIMQPSLNEIFLQIAKDDAVEAMV